MTRQTDDQIKELLGWSWMDDLDQAEEIGQLDEILFSELEEEDLIDEGEFD